MSELLKGALLLATLAAPARFHLGRVATPREVEARDSTVLPTGAGLPQGHGSVQEGQVLFARLCAACHGQKGEGNDWYPALVGGVGTLKRGPDALLTVGSYWPYATTVWDYVHRAMPYPAPGTLTPNEVYALTAYLLHANGILPADAVLDERTLPKVKMPNRDGFVPDPRPDVRATR